VIWHSASILVRSSHRLELWPPAGRKRRREREPARLTGAVPNGDEDQVRDEEDRERDNEDHDAPSRVMAAAMTSVIARPAGTEIRLVRPIKAAHTATAASVTTAAPRHD